MIRRLHVILKDPEYREIQRMARARHMSIADWVRQTLADARRREPGSSAGKKLRAIRAAVRHELPTADLTQMLGEVASTVRCTPLVWWILAGHASGVSTM